jgi:multiple sugar transport system substrate-binding protein
MKKLGHISILAASILVSGIAATTLTGCGSSGSGSDTLEMWAGGQWVGNDAANLQKFITSYNDDETHTTKIKLTIKSEFETQFASSIQVGRQPDLVVWDRFNTPTYVKQDFLYPIDDFITNDNIDTSVFQKQAYDELSYGGHQYGLPLDLDIWGIYVNNSMLKTYNDANPDNKAVLPTTWDELLDTAKKLTISQGDSFSQAGYSSQDMYEHYFKFMVSTGTSFMGSDGYPDYSTDAAKETVTFFKTIYDAKVSNTATSGKDDFKNGKLAMINQPVYFSSYLKTYAPDLQYTFIPQPKMNATTGKQGGMIGGFGFALPKPVAKYQTEAWKTKQSKAWDFMKYWLLDASVQESWSKVSNTLPALKAVYNTDWVKNTEVLSKAASYIDNYECRPGVPGFYYVQVNVYDNYMKSYINGDSKLTIDGLMTKLDTETRKYIDIYNK